MNRWKRGRIAERDHARVEKTLHLIEINDDLDGELAAITRVATPNVDLDSSPQSHYGQTRLSSFGNSLRKLEGKYTLRETNFNLNIM